MVPRHALIASTIDTLRGQNESLQAVKDNLSAQSSAIANDASAVSGASDAINTAMRELFLQIVYGRTQSAFSEGGLIIGAGLEDLGKGLRSQVGTLYGTLAKGPRYLEMAEGYIKQIFLDKNDEICGYEFVHMGKFMDEIKKGTDANEALKKVTGTYGRVTAEQGAVKSIDPRHE